MSQSMRLAVQIVLAYLLMVFFGALWLVVPHPYSMAPLVPVIYALYLGAGARERLPIATFGAAIIGYLGDLLSSSPRGLMAFVCVVICIAGRGISSRLLLRGRLFVAVLGFVSSLVALGLVLLIRVCFGLPFGNLVGWSWAAIGSAVTTALLSPLVFRLCRSLDSVFARTQREREAIREGYLG
ncbi:MAG: hypothetical protein V2A73_16770 [Pseudomonadota bacterium]